MGIPTGTNSRLGAGHSPKSYCVCRNPDCNWNGKHRSAFWIQVGLGIYSRPANIHCICGFAMLMLPDEASLPEGALTEA